VFQYLSQYLLYEQSHAVVAPARAASEAMRLLVTNPLNPLSYTFHCRAFAAACEVFEAGTRRYEKPAFNIESTIINGEPVPVRETIIWERPFCRLLHFERQHRYLNRDPKVVIVAPLAGHYATLLRGTVAAMLPKHDVYITDWSNARDVPLAYGQFGLDDYIEYVIRIFRVIGPSFHVMAVCQPAVPVLAALSLMEETNDPHVPTSMILMGGPIDTRVNPTVINQFAEKRGTDWFRRNVITTVPINYRGFLRKVYPGFIQLSGFMGMNLDRHITRHRDYFFHLVLGDYDSAKKHRAFYDEYRAVMDLTAEFFLQTVDTVFVHHLLATGEMRHRGRLVSPSAIRRVALMTIEGGKDEICGAGQTEAAHGLCGNLPRSMRDHYVQPEAGHYGIFSGSRFRREIVPRIGEFILKAEAASPTCSMMPRRQERGRRIFANERSPQPASSRRVSFRPQGGNSNRSQQRNSHNSRCVPCVTLSHDGVARDAVRPKWPDAS
jgi:poly(3-hydroxybutyrate) depolymerase